MSKGSFRVPDTLGHILQAIQRIHRYADNLIDVTFLANEMVQGAVSDCCGKVDLTPFFPYLCLSLWSGS